MSVQEINGLSSVLARIAQIQAQFGPATSTRTAATGSSAAGSTATSVTSSSDFAASLASATGRSVLGGNQIPAAGKAGLTATTVTTAQVTASAQKYLGVPYVFGGTTATGIDCSGLVQRAYGDLGISLPRLSWDQAKVGTAVPDLASAQPGDILGFGNPAEHVAIYLGNNQMIAAPQPGENVKIQAVYETPASIRRILDTSAPAAAAASATAGAVSTDPSWATMLSGATPNAAGTTSTGISQYAAIFKQVESQYSLPAGLLAAVAQTESGGNASAVSPAGAQGLMQLMPSTAKNLSVNPWDPAQSAAGAGKLLSDYLTKYSSVPLALAAYNAGPGAVDTYGGVPPFTETQNYVSKITALMAGGLS